MTAEQGHTPEGAKETLRLDALLVYLRIARTRSIARAMIEGRSLRHNRKHVQRISEGIAIGDVLTLAIDGEVQVIEIVSLPSRRGSAAQARSCYRMLDR